MKKIFKQTVFVLLCIGMLFSLSSCGLVDSHKQFFANSIEITTLTNTQAKDYFTSESFSFAKLGGVMFVPTMQDRGEEYSIWITCLSEYGNEEILINNMTLKSAGNIIFDHKLDREILLEKGEHFLYSGQIREAIAKEETKIPIEHNTELELSIDVSVTENGEILSETITYDIVVKIRKELLWPT
ncbi:MAG: hypothetical protein E7453_03940 [Ruminococcaceae bacterium]|nr:hypothetical protein [Oscillospiraceae bacterium]